MWVRIDKWSCINIRNQSFVKNSGFTTIHLRPHSCYPTVGWKNPCQFLQTALHTISDKLKGDVCLWSVFEVTDKKIHTTTNYRPVEKDEECDIICDLLKEVIDGSVGAARHIDKLVHLPALPYGVKHWSVCEGERKKETTVRTERDDVTTKTTRMLWGKLPFSTYLKGCFSCEELYPCAWYEFVLQRRLKRGMFKDPFNDVIRGKALKSVSFVSKYSILGT